MDFSSRKKPKSTNKTIRIVRLFFVGLFFIILFFTALIISFFSLDSKGRKNILIVDESVSLLSLDKDNNQITLINIPKSVNVSVSGNRGNVLISGLYKMDSSLSGKGQVLSNTIRDYLGVRVDAWVEIKSFAKITDRDSFDTLRTSLFSPYSLDWSIISAPRNISFSELKRFFWHLSKVRIDKVEIINLADENIYSQDVLADGSLVLNSDQVRLDNVLKDKFTDWNILKERLSIAIYNLTEKPGLASNYARIITNLGGNVIRVDQSELKVDNCLILYAKKVSQSYTLKNIKEMLKCQVKVQSQEDNRADLLININN